MTATDLLVEDTRPAIGGCCGMGLSAEFGAQVDLERAAFVRGFHSALGALDEGTFVSARDLVISSVAPRQDEGTWGVGVEALLDARISIERALIEDAHSAGLYVEDGTLEVSDALVRGTEPAVTSGGAAGLSVHDGSVVLSRTTFEDNRAGLFLEGATTQATLTDVVLRDVDGSLLGVSGSGLNVYAGARADLLRVAIARVRTAGVHVSEGASFAGTDLVVAAMRSQERDGRYGYGVTVDTQAEVDLSRVRVDGARHAAAVAFQARSVLALTDADLGPTLERECAESGCEGGGIGFAAIDGASASLTTFRVHDAALCGVQVATSGSLSLSDGVVEDNLVGVNVQVDPFDYDTIRDRVLYRDNARDLDATGLPLPEPVGAPAE